MPVFSFRYNRRLLSVFLLGFSSGLPLGLVSSTLQAWYTVSGASLMTIGWLTLVGQPYAYKFLWAPLLDRFSWARLGRRRTWIVAMQCGLAISLLLMAYTDPKTMPIWVGIFALITAIFSATQDTAIDAYRTEILETHEQGMGVAFNTIAYRIAMIVSTALALLLAATIGWQMMYAIMGALFLLLAIFTLYVPSPQTPIQQPTDIIEAISAPCRELFQRPYIVWLLIFIVIYKLCDAMALSLNTTFLIRGMGFTLIEIGAVSKMIGLVAALLGSVAGGWLMPRLGVYRALLQFGFLQAASNLLYAWLAWYGKNMIVMSAALFGEYFCGGLATVALVVFLMQLCDRRYTATQYALFSAVAALGRIFIGPLAAVIVKHVGWIDFYVITALTGVPALMIVWWLRQNCEQLMAA